MRVREGRKAEDEREEGGRNGRTRWRIGRWRGGDERRFEMMGVEVGWSEGGGVLEVTRLG